MKAEVAVQALEVCKDRLFILPLDLGSNESIENAASAFREHFDHLDVLVNNAGILLDDADLILTISGDVLNQSIDTNTIGPLRVTKTFLPLLKESSDGRVVNVSSLG